jgi:hypothetical protein
MHGGSGLGKLACVMMKGLEGASPAAMASSTKRMMSARSASRQGMLFGAAVSASAARAPSSGVSACARLAVGISLVPSARICLLRPLCQSSPPCKQCCQLRLFGRHCSAAPRHLKEPEPSSQPFVHASTCADASLCRPFGKKRARSEIMAWHKATAKLEEHQGKPEGIPAGAFAARRDPFCPLRPLG